MPEQRILDQVLNLPELEALARQILPEMSYEYVASGAADEITVGWNRTAYDRIALRPRMLSGTNTPDLTVPMLGGTLRFPILLAPTAYHRTIHSEGEIATATGAGKAGATLIVSSASTTPIEKIAEAATGPLWFQIYFQSERDFTADVIQRATAAGCEALCLTVDTPVLGARNRQTRARFELGPGIETPHLFDIGQHGRAIMDPTREVLSWKDVEWLRSISSVPLFLKGILAGEDAARAIDSGADGVIVSNHGGRNLDTALATIDALPEIVEDVQGRVPVLVDGGIRRGTDVVKALALGANAVLIGRPYLYGLAVGGADGVARCVEILVKELEMAMMLCGIKDIDGIDESIIFSRS
jgi:4-hydroxymandelate oxidase